MTEQDEFMSVASWHQLTPEERTALIDKEIDLCERGIAMTKQHERYNYSVDIESIVDMKDSVDGLGVELTTPDVVLRLNQLEADNDENETLINRSNSAMTRAVKAEAENETLKGAYEKLLLLIGVFLDKVLVYADHRRGCTWDDGTKGDVCTCGFRPLISEFYAAQDTYDDILKGE